MFNMHTCMFIFIVCGIIDSLQILLKYLKVVFGLNLMFLCFRVADLVAFPLCTSKV